MNATSVHEKLKQKNGDLELLTKIIKTVHKSSGLEEVYRTALDSVMELEDVDMVAIYLIDEERREAVLQAHRNIPEDYIKRAGRIPYPKGLTWKLIINGRVMNIENIQKDPHAGPAGKDLGHHSVLGIPIFLEEKVIGVIWFGSYKECRFDEREISSLSTLGDQIAIIIAKTKMFEEMKQQEAALQKAHAELEKRVIERTAELSKANERLQVEITERRRFEELLQGSEERFRTLYEYNPSMYFTVSTEGNVLSVNHSGAEQLGYTPEQLIGQSVLKVFHEDDKEAVLGQLMLCLQSPGHVFRWELRKVRSDGSMIWVRESARTAEDNRGDTIILIVCEDITERKRAEGRLRESEEKYRTLVEHSYDLIIEVSINGRFLYVSAKHKELLGYEPEELLGRSIFENIHPDDYPAVISEFQKAIQSLSSGHAVYRYRHKDGQWHWLESTGKPFKTSTGEILTIIASQDITERRRAEEALRESFVQLSKKNRYESIISAVTQSVHQSIDLQDVLENAVDAMSKNIDGADNISIFLIEGEDLSKPYCEPQYERLSQAEAVLKAYRGYPGWFIERVRRIPYPKGFTWKTIIDGKPRYCPDVDQDTFIGPAGREMGTKSYASMPIHFEDNAVGCIAINSLQKNAFDEEELKLLGIVARQIEIAINNAQQAEALRQSEEALREKLVQLSKKNRYEEIINSVTQSVHQSINLQEVLENAVKAMNENIDRADIVAIYLIEEKEAILKAYTGFIDRHNIERVERIPYPKGLTWKTIMERKPIYCADVDQDTVIGPAGKALGIKSYASMPVGFESKTLGTLNIISFQKNAFSEEELKLMEIVAWQIEVAIDNAKQAEALRRSEEALLEAKAGLEARVQERTVELRKTNEQLLAEITERKRAEDKVKTSLREKELLLKEIHHRVKNNLQVISSLLNLQAPHITDMHLQGILLESCNRIRSMALVHEQLYRAHDIIQIDFHSYLKSLVKDLLLSYSIQPDMIKVNLNVQGILFDIDTAIPCGLLINELISNCLKHAFPQGQKGEIHIAISRQAGNRYRLIVKDTGVGFPAELDIRNIKKSLGLRLVMTLTKQLQGNIALERSNGTAFHIDFAEIKYKERR